MGTHGGKRPGAGRKPTRERFASNVTKAEKRIADRLPDLIDNLFELAEGVTVQEIDGHGNRKVYDRPPDFRAASYLLDRILGKPVQAVDAEVSGPDNGALLIRVVYDDQHPDPDAADPAPGAAASDPGSGAF